MTGLGRLAIGGAFLADPVTAVRVLGVDTASAKRMAFLARMAAARDIVLGAGALLTRNPAAKAGWIAAGATADVADAVVIRAAAKQGTAGPIPATAIAAGALAAAAAGFWAAGDLYRSRLS